jgi:hypothetical protein
MGDHKNSTDKSRRWFLSLLTADKTAARPGMVKMLTADGKLVEVEKTVVENAKTNKKATNKEIYEWMQNPSKEKNY